MFHDRLLLEALRGRTSLGKVRILLGARQTGKTALLRHLIEDRASAHFDLQDRALRQRFEQDPSHFSREVRALPKETRFVVVDEIQKVPALLDEVQHLYDSAPKAREIFLTGSSARHLRRGVANLLPGRSHLYRLLPVTRWEHAAPSVVDPLLAPPNDVGRRAPPFPRQTLARSLLFGSLPGVMLEDPATAAASLISYVEVYLEEEIRREALVRDLGAFGRFVTLAGVESGRTLNLTNLSQESGIAQSTLKSYYQVLEDTFVGYFMAPYLRSGRKRILSTPRFYFFDTGVRVAAAGFPFLESFLEAEGGPLLEHWVALELMGRALYRGRGHSVAFWRTATGAEVDFVWQTTAEDLPIEVKWTERPRPEDARHLHAFLDAYPRRAQRGLLVCRTPRRAQLTDRVQAIPWSEL